ncbi:MAG: EAL domain-containing protein [Tahibacter sp.]
MNPESLPAGGEAGDEIAALIETLHRTSQRLEHLTSGQIDAVADHDGRPFLLRHAQERFLSSEASRQASILDALPASIALLDNQGIIVSVNEAWRQFADANALQGPAHTVGVNYLAICDQARGTDSFEARRAASGIRSVLKAEAKHFSLEYPCHSATEQRWFLLTVTPLSTERLSGAVVMHLDISERKRAESTIAASELRFRSLFANMLEGYAYCQTVFEGDRLEDFIYVEVNNKFEEMTGLKGVVGQKVSAVIPGVREAQPDLFDVYGRIALTGRPEKCEVWFEDLGIWLSISAYSNSREHFVAIFENITVRKMAQDALKISLAEFRLLAESMPQIVWITQPDGACSYFNQKWTNYTGMAVDDSLGDRWTKAFHPDDLGPVLVAWQHAIATGDTYSVQCRLRRTDGIYRWWLIRRLPVKDAAGAIAKWFGTCTDIDDLKLAALEISRSNLARDESENKFRQLAENISDVFFLRDAESGRILYISPAFEQIWGRSCASAYANQEAWSDAIVPEDRATVTSKFKSTPVDGQLDYEYRIRVPDGSIRWIETRSFPVHDETGKMVRIAGISKDITERKLAQIRIMHLTRVEAVSSGINAVIARARDSDELFSAACKIATDAGGFRMSFIGVIDENSRKVVVRASAGKDEELLTAVSAALASNDVAPRTMVMTAIREKKAVVCNDSRSDPRLFLGAAYAAADVRSLAILPLMVDGKVVGVFVLYSSVTEFFHDEEMRLLHEMAGNVAFAIDHIKKSERLDYLAYYDPLTALPNRTLFLDRVAQAMRASATAGTSLSVVVLDLERFAQINGQQGQMAGDAVLVWVTARLTRTLGNANLLAHLGADQFALVILEEFREADESRVLERIAAALREDPLCHEDTVIRVAAKFGIARFPDDGVDAQSLLKHAVVALKLARSSGVAFAYFSKEMNIRNTLRLALAEQLRGAIDAKQFVLHYQPKVDMISGEIVGAEALIRWLHPDKGLLQPTAFIGLAEETGLIEQIGAWVVEAVCAQQAVWLASGCRTVPIAVNVSSVQLERGDLLQVVRGALARHSINGNLLDLELTESAVMNDTAAVAVILRGLRKLGVRLALDDFGTGYSSLAYLKQFAFDSVKIERSFITDITRDAGDAAMITAIIAMAHSLHLKVVAEGVETLGQFNYLRAQGCDEMQGFFFRPPVAKDEFESDLRNASRMQMPVQAPDNQQSLLLVDDEPRILAALSRMLRTDGYRILTANGGAEALEILAINPVQVIISDQRMPEMSGTEFLDTVRQIYPGTIRMILSGYTDLDVVTESVNRGAVFKFLTKPWDDEPLREHVREAFRRYRTQVKR